MKCGLLIEGNLSPFVCPDAPPFCPEIRCSLTRIYLFRWYQIFYSTFYILATLLFAKRVLWGKIGILEKNLFRLENSNSEISRERILISRQENNKLMEKYSWKNLSRHELDKYFLGRDLSKFLTFPWNLYEIIFLCKMYTEQHRDNVALNKIFDLIQNGFD